MARGRGGQRAGTPGKSYSNRTDLNQPASADVYGDRKASQERMEAVPLQRAAPPTTGVQQQPPAAPLPLNRPSDRPMEPVTAGLPTGPGPGPEALGLGQDDFLTVLRAAYEVAPSPELLRLILDEQAVRG